MFHIPVGAIIDHPLATSRWFWGGRILFAPTVCGFQFANISIIYITNKPEAVIVASGLFTPLHKNIFNQMLESKKRCNERQAK